MAQPLARLAEIQQTFAAPRAIELDRQLPPPIKRVGDIPQPVAAVPQHRQFSFLHHFVRSQLVAQCRGRQFVGGGKSSAPVAVFPRQGLHLGQGNIKDICFALF